MLNKNESIIDEIFSMQKIYDLFVYQPKQWGSVVQKLTYILFKSDQSKQDEEMYASNALVVYHICGSCPGNIHL